MGCGHGLAVGRSVVSIEMTGVQLGGFNRTRSTTGVQIGLYNYSRHLRGFQIGLINRSAERTLPLLNWGFD